ncbi:4-(cytidine 5'-diphospho)-2-C-methyl-D-erythritol kinase [Lactobacillus sp. Sy-1]|uniref:4-(cytidine 5'-diphospho)-2-C-methyl-D-erythritol kinase n=1 Tax=Lactobacillus sp. Sy-1 TaxID=2109645 RepID=UPI001C592E58|nr:4-(cytidine 5'-diphospho)-2-C-methyl-D-erythritol kinase [Lactobacillus sp. Sy-1]MBW1604805.1 4-(cytidine 5'-diphospho)-2-C-methyl-D-erythritol kinase [Lactobacillus sp. Sy-1]
MRIVEKAPAKINLGLDTPYMHDDGLPEWNMVMASVDLADYVEIKTDGSGLITVESDSVFIPNDQRNLAYQAALLITKQYHINDGIQIKITKHIPIAAGLGGGSSDAAAVLRGLNKLYQIKLTNRQLAELGLKVDSDVPYCIYSQTARVTGRGEIIEVMPKLPSMWVVIVKPRISVSTPKILQEIDYQNLIHPDIEKLLFFTKNGDLNGITANMGNVLEAISGKRYPEIIDIKNRLISFGADGSQMSGTGPTVFAVCHKYSRAKRILNSIRGFCNEAYLVRPL